MTLLHIQGFPLEMLRPPLLVPLRIRLPHRGLASSCILTSAFSALGIFFSVEKHHHLYVGHLATAL